MIERKQLIRLGLALAVIVTLACNDDNNNNTPTEPPPPTPEVTEVFMGQFEQLSADCSIRFTTNNGGGATFRYLDLEPLFTLTVGLAVGQPNPGAELGCELLVEDDSVNIGDSIFVTLNTGEFCVCAYDSGNVFPGEVVDYTLEITYPE